jgi:integrase
MASKVIWYREAWWVRTRWAGTKKRERRIGPTKADKRAAEEIAKKINGALALGTFAPDAPAEAPSIRCADELRRWHELHRVTMSPAYEIATRGLIDNHLIDAFGERELGSIGHDDLLTFVQRKLDAGLSPKTIRNALAVLHRVMTLAVRDGRLSRNPASGLSEIIRRAERRVATEAHVIDTWTREEAETLLRVAREHEPRFAPVLHLALATGCRRGEILGLRWGDVDFSRSRVTIRRAITQRILTTPKNGRARMVAMAPTLAAELLDLLAERRREMLGRGWTEVPDPVFCSEIGTPVDERNFERSWQRVRRRAQRQGVRPLRFHAARHTFATLSLEAGKSVRWVAAQLGHSDPALTIRVYAHSLPSEEADLSHLDFGGADRRYPSLGLDEENAGACNLAELLARREGFEPPTLRFEA